jgi:hypothetical protein
MPRLEDVDIDLAWEEVLDKIAALEADGVLPSKTELYDPRLDTVRLQLQNGHPTSAISTARDMRWSEAYGNLPAAFAAYELIKLVLLQVPEHAESGRYAGDSAAKVLTEIRRKKAKPDASDDNRWTPYVRR